MYQFAAAQSQCTWKVTLMGHSVASVDVGEFQFAQPPAMPLQLPLIRGFSLKGPNGTPIRTPLYIQSMGVTIAASITAVVAFLVIIFALPVFFWVRRRRRRLLAPSTPAANDEQPSALKPLTDRAPGPISGQEIVASSLPGTTNSMPRPYVCDFMAPVPQMCVHVFCLRYNSQNPDDPGSYPPYRGNLPPRTYHSIQSPSSSSGRNLYTVAAAPNSQGQVPGYSGPARYSGRPEPAL